MTDKPSNAELAHEAFQTANCERQQELASHPSFTVRQKLARNKRLCAAAAEILGDELPKLRLAAKDAVNQTLDK